MSNIEQIYSDKFKQSHDYHYDNDSIPSTDAGEVAFEMKYDFMDIILHVSGCFILNQCGLLLTRGKHDIKGSNQHHFFRVCYWFLLESQLH